MRGLSSSEVRYKERSNITLKVSTSSVEWFFFAWYEIKVENFILWIFIGKDWFIKKETKVDAYISINFSHILTNFVPQKIQILIAFIRGALFYCSFIIKEIWAFLVKLVKNWNVLISSNFTNFSINNFTKILVVVVIY